MDQDDSDPNWAMYDEFDYDIYSDYESFDEFFNFDKGPNVNEKDALDNQQNQNMAYNTIQNNNSIKINTCIGIQHSLIEKIRKELGIDEKEFQKFFHKLKKAQKNRKKTYRIKVNQDRYSGNGKKCCTSCIRQILSLSDEGFIFKEAFYHFTYGEVFDKSLVQKLHNNICSSLGLRKATVQEGRNIRKYFNNFASHAFQIIKEARIFLRDNPEFRTSIYLSKQNKK